MLGADVKLVKRRDSLYAIHFTILHMEDVVHSTYRRFQYELYWLCHLFANRVIALNTDEAAIVRSRAPVIKSSRWRSLRSHGLTPLSLAEGSGDRREPVPGAGMLTC